MTSVDAPAGKAEPRPDGRSDQASKVEPSVRKATKCPCCGRDCVVRLAPPGRLRRYRNAALTLPAYLLVPPCRRCGYWSLPVDPSSPPGEGTVPR